MIYGEFTAKAAGYRIELTGQSPLTGVQLSHRIDLLAGNRVRFSSRLTNIREDTTAWGIGTNMQLSGASRCYAPAAAADTMWFKKNVTANLDTIPHPLVDGYFTFLPETVTPGKSTYMTKACIHPQEPRLAAFNSGQMLIIKAPKISRQAIYPTQEQIEIFNMLAPGTNEDLLELNFHSAYDTLAPGAFTETTQVWTVKASLAAD